MPAVLRLVSLLLSIAAALTLAAPSAAPAAAPEDVTIYRDAFGIPHIEAPSMGGISYGTGYALAHDRPFLLSAIRLTAQGRASELLGEGSLDADVAQRRDFFDAQDVRRQLAELSPERRAELRAFSDGVNDGWAEVKTNVEERPALWDALSYDPEPWTPFDSVSVTALFTYTTFAGEGGGGQLRNAALLHRLVAREGRRKGTQTWNDLVWKNDPRAPTVIPKGEGTRPRRSVTTEKPGPAQRRLADEFGAALNRSATRRDAEALRVKRAIAKLPIPKIGSYAAALAGSRTRSGGGVLVGSPQAGFTAPSVFWQIAQHSPGRDCTGFTVPGLGPWVGVGFCNRHSWSLVAGNIGEQVDNYVERVDPDDARRYRFEGEWRTMDVRRETFKVNRCVPPLCATASPPRTETRTFEDTVHGPVVDRQPAAGIAITQRRAQRGNFAGSLEALARWNTARSVTEFDKATDLANASYNLVYADADGHILYRFTGLQPVRAVGWDRRLPASGTGEAEWRGYLPDRAMPRVLDPKSGILVANQGIESKPVDWWPSASSVGIGQASRVRGNRQLLGRAGPVDVPALKRLNPELLERVDSITPIFEGAIRRATRGATDPRVRQATELFDRWAKAGYPRRDADADGSYDDPALAIWGADDFALPYKRYLWTDLLQRVLGDEVGTTQATAGERGTFQAPGTGLAQLSTLKLVLDRAVGRRGGLRLRTDFLPGGRSAADAAIRASLDVALTKLAQEYGTDDMTQWKVAVRPLTFGALGVASVATLTRSFDHGTYSQVVDPRAGVGEYILPPGNMAADSASRTAAATLGRPPAHFDDQREIYGRYEFISMLQDPLAYRAAPESVQTLRYPG